MLEIAQLCQESSDADWICTADLLDAVALRKHGITKPLLVLSFINADPALLAQHDIDVVVYNLETIKELNAVGQRFNKQINVHLKIDTGMSRFGIMPEQALSFIAEIKKLPCIMLRGISTHLAEAANSEQTFTQHQLNAFENLLGELKNNNIHIPIKHAANTAGTTGFGTGSNNLYRLGIGLYGFWPSEANKYVTTQKFPWFNLQPVLTWKTRILDIKVIPAGSYVGYDRTFKTNREMIIGIVPIGYYDGYDRRLSNAGTFLINPNKPGAVIEQRYARVIGRVCMNLTMLDISGIADVQINDEVIVMGNYPHVRPGNIAVLANSHNTREITTRINPTIPRIITV